MSIKKIRLILVVLFSSFFLSACSIPFIGSKKKAALQINSTPKATVFLNGEHVGTTPFVDENLKEGEFLLKLVPESSGTALGSWESRVKLVSGILTVVSRQLAALEENASGYTITLEPIPSKDKSSLTVVSTPDKAIVTMNGEPKGFAPLSLDSISESDHEILLSLPGYVEQKITAKAINGYKLLITAQLARSNKDNEGSDATDSADKVAKGESDDEDKVSTSSADLERPYVTINSPDIGWVRIRAETSTSSEELGKANHGESYKLLDTTPAGWYQIEYKIGKEGWISGKYAEKYE